MHKTYLSLALALILALPLRAHLTVVIAVNGLDEAALKEMQPFWPQGGLRTLSEEAYQTTVRFPHWLYGGDETLATLLTGVTPKEHGICSNYFFSRETREVKELFLNNKKMGIGTPFSYSCEPLLTHTVVDQWRLATGATSKIYAIGLEPASTILLAGHSANGCCWLGQTYRKDSIRWVSTSYYQDGLPSVADHQNISGALSETLARTWEPRMELTTYLHPTDSEKKHGFSYHFSPDACNQYPQANTAVVDLALALQQDTKLGLGASTDLLMLQLTAVTPKTQQNTIASVEQEDMYLCLNQDIGFLMEQLQRRLGEQHTLRIVVLGLPKVGANAELMSKYNMPVQYLSMEKVTALTATYLMALYGHERWVEGGYGHSIYLNRMLIEQKHLSLETIRRQVADFLMEFDGINFACPSSEAYLYPDIATSVNKRFLGDVVFTLQPNYMLSNLNPSTLDNTLLPATYTPSPVFIWSTARIPYPPAIHAATEVANYIL